jgi:superfamily II DNA/RNA helicase
MAQEQTLAAKYSQAVVANCLSQLWYSALCCSFLQSCLAESGIELPSPIQEAAIPQLLAGHNAAVQSYTGSGKVSLKLQTVCYADHNCVTHISHRFVNAM